MSLISARTRRPRHRAVDKVAELHADNQRLITQLVGAAGHITRLELQLKEARTHQAEAEQVVVCLDADLIERTEERDELRDELATTRALLAPYLAAEANAAAVTVPASERDTTAIEDQATTPIDVRPLWDAHGIAPVRVADAPDLDDPRTPTWVPDPDSETTQSLRVIAA
ncbi:hypothetical protein ACIOYT_00520 [Streptomyces halstedii]|uniref:hypothetical protein n=1 Tax=Streptomyces halstedii TaxID=1944 RepID=UPI003811D34B